MTPTISSAARKRLALVTFAALWLSACGGGGGSDETVAAAPPSLPAASGSPGTAAPSPSAGGPAASPAPAPSDGMVTTPAPAPAVFQAWGPIVVDTGAASPSPNSVARLSTGASVVAWIKGTALLAQLLDPTGATVGPPLRITGGLTTPVAFSIAPLHDGQWIATWAGAATGSGSTILFQRFSAAGQAIGGVTQIPGTFATAFSLPVARATADGGLVIGWASRLDATQPAQAAQGYVARFAPDGTSMGGPVRVSTMAGDQFSVGVSPLSDGSVLVTWLQAGAAGQSPSAYARPFAATGQPAGPEQPVLAVTFESNLAAVPLGGTKVAVAGSRGYQVAWQVLDASGTPLGDAGSVTGTGEVNHTALVDAGGGSFQVLYQNVDQSPLSMRATISVQRVDSTGVPAGEPSVVVQRRSLGVGIVEPTAGADFSASGATDGHYILSYEASGDTLVEVRAQAQ